MPQLDRKFIFNGGNSTRYHTMDVHNRQSIGDHSFGVAFLCEIITGGKASKNLIMAALAHDLAEHIVGDIPAPAKRALNLQEVYAEFEYQHLYDAGIGTYETDLYSFEKTVLKLSDCFEGLIFCIRERKLGNRNVEVATVNYTSYIRKLLGTEGQQAHDIEGHAGLARAEELLKELLTEWEEASGKF